MWSVAVGKKVSICFSYHTQTGSIVLKEESTCVFGIANTTSAVMVKCSLCHTQGPLWWARKGPPHVKGPSHEEVKVWWAAWHLEQGNLFTLVATHASKWQ